MRVRVGVSAGLCRSTDLGAGAKRIRRGRTGGEWFRAHGTPIE